MQCGLNKEPISWLDGNQPNGAVISCDLGKTNTDLYKKKNKQKIESKLLNVLLYT